MLGGLWLSRKLQAAARYRVTHNDSEPQTLADNDQAGDVIEMLPETQYPPMHSAIQDNQENPFTFG